MTAETDLLPLPERFSFMEWETHMRDYARANLAELQREVEGLRAEVATWKGLRESEASVRKRWQARAERLAEALRDAREYVASELAAERDKFAGYEHCSNIASIESDIAKIDAALDQETTNG